MTIQSHSAEGWSSYLGVATQWMPNFLQTMGSHTSLGHNSMICMMECQTSYIVSFIKQVGAVVVWGLMADKKNTITRMTTRFSSFTYNHAHADARCQRRGGHAQARGGGGLHAGDEAVRAVCR